MSSSFSSSKNLSIQNQGQQLFDKQNDILTPRMNIGRHSPVPPSTTRVIASRPFYRSQVTPDPFDYSNDNRRQEYLPPSSSTHQRRYSVHQINDSSPLNSYLSDQELSSMHQPQYRTIIPNNNNTKRALISVSSNSKQSPLITIAAGGKPTRSEIRLSPSPKITKSTVHEIRISRPDSPSILINRTGANQTISNGSGNAFHISVGTPTAREIRGRTPPSFHQIEMHRDSPINFVANRFKPLIAFTSPNDRSTISNSTSLTMHNDNLRKKDQNDVENLTKILMKSINSSNEPNFFGMCARCNDEIVGEENGLVAMDRMYHVSCFTCTMCGCRLRGMHFYSMENKPYCESCYVNSLEKCVACSQPITDRILRATGKAYHAQCFNCISCQKNLDGTPFTVDASMQIHCLDCFHQKFAPRCYACQRPILPQTGQEETVRIIALDRNYHIDCYRCENCKIQFSNEQGCHPIHDHIYCFQCNLKYAKTLITGH